MKLQHTINGEIRENSLSNVRQIFQHDKALKNIHFFKTGKGKTFLSQCFTTAFPWSEKALKSKVTKFDDDLLSTVFSFDFDLDILEIRMYIEDHYHYLPSKSAVMNYVKVRFYTNDLS